MATKYHHINYELNISWIARLDHLEYRMWIEENEANALSKGKTSYNRISHLHNDQLLQLAIENYELKQSIYKKELEELKCGHSKVIFQALDNLVSEASTKYLQQVGIYDDITNSMQDLKQSGAKRDKHHH
ncbi:S-linalool synthase [Glycine soja]|nr:S-linalool synthase [Glycine soja]